MRWRVVGNREKMCMDGKEGVVGKTSERKEVKSAGHVTLNLRPNELGRGYLLYPWGEMCARLYY